MQTYTFPMLKILLLSTSQILHENLPRSYVTIFYLLTIKSFPRKISVGMIKSFTTDAPISTPLFFIFVSWKAL